MIHLLQQLIPPMAPLRRSSEITMPCRPCSKSIVFPPDHGGVGGDPFHHGYVQRHHERIHLARLPHAAAVGFTGGHLVHQQHVPGQRAGAPRRAPPSAGPCRVRLAVPQRRPRPRVRPRHVPRRLRAGRLRHLPPQRRAGHQRPLQRPAPRRHLVRQVLPQLRRHQRVHRLRGHLPPGVLPLQERLRQGRLREDVLRADDPPHGGGRGRLGVGCADVRHGAGGVRPRLGQRDDVRDGAVHERPHGGGVRPVLERLGAAAAELLLGAPGRGGARLQLLPTRRDIHLLRSHRRRAAAAATSSRAVHLQGQAIRRRRAW
ncbi:hypothetical protein EE612_022466 [Oryza sativa]|nr:hypothetical protein EE612_022466 [Oryza sativa]